MSFFDRFKKMKPVTRVTLKYAKTDREVHIELCHLAWQMIAGGATYDDVVGVIQSNKVFSVPNDDYAHLDVRDYHVYDGEKGRDYHIPGDRNMSIIASEEGERLGCIYEAENSVSDLTTYGDAREFIECLDQVTAMYAKVKEGKKLPKEEPKKKEEDSNEKEEPKTEAEEEQQEPTEDMKKETIIMAYRPIYDLLGKLPNNDAVAIKLRGMTHDEREDTFDGLLAEYNAVMVEMQQYAEKYLSGMAFYATAIKSFNSDRSSAAKFLRELEAEQPKKDKKQANYISRQLKNVNSWIKQAEKDGDDFALDLLREMKKALKNGDSKKYDEIKKRYDRLVSADQQTNPKKDSSTDDTGKDEQTAEDSGSEEESKDENPEDTTSEEETSEESAGSESEDADADATPEDEQEDEEDDTEYTIQDVILMLKLAGYDEVPKPIRLLAKNRKVTKESLQQVLETYGIEGVI